MTEPDAWIEHHKGGDNLNWERVDHPYAKATPLYSAAKLAEVYEACAKICENTWKNATNNTRQNAIGPGCVESAHAIRAAAKGE